MIRSVLFRVYDDKGDVIYAEVRNYKAKTRTGYIRRYCYNLMNKLQGAMSVQPFMLDGEHKAEVWLDTTQGTMQEVHG